MQNMEFKTNLKMLSKNRARTATASAVSTKNYVSDASKMLVSTKPNEKQYKQGVYTQHHPSKCEHMLNNRPIHLKLKSATDGKDFIKVITTDNIRDMIIPNETANVYPTIWPTTELGRIKKVGKIITKTERQRQIEMHEQEKRQIEIECEERKKVLQEFDRKRGGGRNFLQTQSDSEDSSNKILDRAFVAKQEQIPEVQLANRLILATKCHVLRDAQVVEKNEIEREIREENLRLEKMMLVERDKALQKEDNRREHSRKLNEKHALELKNQLHEREMNKVMEAERIENEAKSMAKAQIAITIDMMAKEQEKKKQMARVRQELQKSNQLSEFFKSLAFEEQRIADMKAQEFKRQKEEHDRQIAYEKRLANEQKQREADRMLAIQTKFLMTKGAQEEMSLRRSQEEKEREFRQREKEAAIKRKQTIIELEVARLAQLEALKQTRAISIMREEIDFQNSVEKLKKAEIKELEEKNKRLEMRKNYRNEIIGQMNEKEINRQVLKNADKSEHIAQIEDDKERDKNIKQFIKLKMNTLKGANIPEKFIKDIERQLNKPKKLVSTIAK